MWLEALSALLFAMILWLTIRGGPRASSPPSRRMRLFTRFAITAGAAVSMSPLAWPLLDLFGASSLRGAMSELMALLVVGAVMASPWLWLRFLAAAASTRSSLALVAAAGAASAVLAAVALAGLIAAPPDVWSGAALLSLSLYQIILVGISAGIRRYVDGGSREDRGTLARPSRAN